MVNGKMADVVNNGLNHYAIYVKYAAAFSVTRNDAIHDAKISLIHKINVNHIDILTVSFYYHVSANVDAIL